jgi:hypothetical protein
MGPLHERINLYRHRRNEPYGSTCRRPPENSRDLLQVQYLAINLRLWELVNLVSLS